MKREFYFLSALMIIVVMNPISAFAESEIPDWIKQVANFWITDQIDDEGFALSIFDSILDYTKDDDAVDKKDLHVTTKNGQHQMCKTTCG